MTADKTQSLEEFVGGWIKKTDPEWEVNWELAQAIAEFVREEEKRRCLLFYLGQLNHFRGQFKPDEQIHTQLTALGESWMAMFQVEQLKSLKEGK